MPFRLANCLLIALRMRNLPSHCVVNLFYYRPTRRIRNYTDSQLFLLVAAAKLNAAIDRQPSSVRFVAFVTMCVHL